MNFTPEHTVILEANYHHWATLRDAGYVTNLERITFNALHQVHNEVMKPMHVSHWCSACVADMIRILFTCYDRFKLSTTTTEDNVPETTTKPRGGRKRPVLDKGEQGPQVVPEKEGVPQILLPGL